MELQLLNLTLQHSS